MSVAHSVQQAAFVQHVDIAAERVRFHLDGLKKALAVGGDTHGVEDVLAQVARGDAQLWTEPDGVIVTEVADAPKCRELRFWIATGKLETVLAMHERIIVWARGMGCTQAVLTGRRGWVKALAGSGWVEQMVVMGRKL